MSRHEAWSQECYEDRREEQDGHQGPACDDVEVVDCFIAGDVGWRVLQQRVIAARGCS